jgi:putative flippase GtrA
MMRQPLLFVIAGALQYLFDAAVYGLLIAAGLPSTPANVLSRASAALLGFGFNRYITFAQPQSAEESWSRFRASLARFAVLWIAMTVVSSLLLLAAQALFGGGLAERVIYKLVVEGILAVISFFVSRHWVFRN